MGYTWDNVITTGTTTTTSPKTQDTNLIIDKKGNLIINGKTFTMNPITTTAKINLDGEEFSAEDIKFIHELKNNKIQEDKEQGMDIMKNFNFGPCGDRAKISHLGIAVQNSNGEWVSYDKENNEIVNVDLINFGNSNLVYMLPVALKDVAEGDAIIHNRHVMFVVKAKEKTISVIDVTDGEIKKILPTKSVFGFDFITKIVSLVDFTASTANEDNPFGNMLPFLLLGNSNNKDNDALPLALMLMSKNNQECGGFSSSFSSSQMALLAMMNQNKDSNMLPLMFLMNQNK